MFQKPFKITTQKRGGLSNFDKPVFDFSVVYSKTSALSKKLKVFTFDILIKKLGLQVSHSKVPSSDKTILLLPLLPQLFVLV